MLRQIIKINEDECNGCGLCVSACHEGAIQLVDGKAKLIRADYCDGLGNCLPVCPTGAITFEQRDTLEFDQAAVEEKMRMASSENASVPQTAFNTGSSENISSDAAAKADIVSNAGAVSGSGPASMKDSNSGLNTDSNAKSESGCKTESGPGKLACGCPSTLAKTIKRPSDDAVSGTTQNQSAPVQTAVTQFSNLRQWPVQIQLVPVNAPYLDGAHLLIAADCAAYAHPSFNQTFMKNKVTIIGCPKLDDTDYSEKLTAILSRNNIKSVTVVRMEVPCCGGIVSAAIKALKDSEKMIPWNVVILGTDGTIIEQ